MNETAFRRNQVYVLQAEIKSRLSPPTFDRLIEQLAIEGLSVATSIYVAHTKEQDSQDSDDGSSKQVGLDLSCEKFDVRIDRHCTEE